MSKAQSISNYILLLVVVFTALSAMNVYVKRSIQAKVKDMSDAMIGGVTSAVIEDEHLFQVNDADSTVNRSQYAFSGMSLSSDGVQQVRGTQRFVIDSQVVSIDPDKDSTEGYTSPDIVAIDPLTYNPDVLGVDKSSDSGSESSR